LIQRNLAAEFDGEVELEYPPNGLECTICCARGRIGIEREPIHRELKWRWFLRRDRHPQGYRSLPYHWPKSIFDSESLPPGGRDPHLHNFDHLATSPNLLKRHDR
jgi:hypothetical protein